MITIKQTTKEPMSGKNFEIIKKYISLIQDETKLDIKIKNFIVDYTL